MKWKVKDKEIITLVGDIASQESYDAVVNAANKDLRTGGGVAGAIHRKAGPELETATRAYAPIEVSEAVTTQAFDLPYKKVIHALGPVFGVDNPSDRLLKRTYENIFNELRRRNIVSVCVPAISTGAFGYPLREAALIALKTLDENLARLRELDRIAFVLYDQDAYELYNRILEELYGEGEET